MGEILAALIEGFVALLQLALEGIAFLISGSMTLVACLFSKRFRDRKQTEWKGKKVRKSVELGFGALCLAGFVAVAVWLLLPNAKAERSKTAVEVEKAQNGEDIRLKLQVTKDETQRDDVRVVIKQGGTARILGTKTVKELREQLVDNVSVIAAKPDGVTNSTAILPSTPDGTGADK